MNLTIEYQLSYDEFIEGIKGLQQNFRGKKSERSKLIRRMLGWVVFFILLAFILSLRQRAPSRISATILDSTWPWALLFVFMWAIILAMARRHTRDRVRRVWYTTPSLHRVHTLTVTDQGLSETSATRANQTSWAHYTSVRETPNLILLFTSEVSAEMVPKRVLPDAATTQALVAFLRQSIIPPATAFPVTALPH